MDGEEQSSRIDWEAVERSEEFQQLVGARRRFVLPRVVFFLAWYFGFVLLAGYAPGFMGERIYEGLTVGYALALTQFVMVWYLAARYLRKADSEFEPLERAAAQAAAASAPSANGRQKLTYLYDGERYHVTVETTPDEVRIIGRDPRPTILDRGEFLAAIEAADRQRAGR
jgi:uncharacterized membrane protein (DUF485 family)